MDQPAKKILIVDDEPALLKMMALYLKRKGHLVTTVDSTDAAWETVGESSAEFVAAVLDASMRGLSAQDLGLRLLASNPEICVIVASGYPVDMSRLTDAGPGRVEFLQKPFAPEALDGTLRRMIASQEKNV
jgi:two-component system alkaline phosphatase synthesis response regulator PhoP